MRGGSFCVARFLAIALIILVLFACGHGRRAAFAPQLGSVTEPASLATAEVTWPASLPTDALQPWEQTDGSGRVVSSINLDSQFVPGVERFSDEGDVSDLGEAASFASGAPGAEAVSYALYRIPLGNDQPGTIAADVNLHAGASYYLGVADYSANTWRWHGPFSAPHVRVPLPHYEYTSTLGNLFIAVVAYDGAAFDLVGLGVNARDDADTAAPEAPDAPILTPVAGGLHVRWLKVDEEDLAGYRIYADGEEALNYLEGGTSVVIPATAETEIALTSVDLSGNESEPSEASTDTPLTGDIPTIELTASAASGGRNTVIELTASGADTYDWDVDGDGNYDITGDATGTATASTASFGIIRPAIQGHTADGGFSLSAVSLLIAGNSRPVAAAYADPSSGCAPLDVSFMGEGEDDDGTIAEYAWDFDGDGVYDSASQNPPPHQYSTVGLYNAKLRVTDNEGAWDVDTVGVNVLPDPANLPPVISATVDVPSGGAPLSVNFTITADDADGTITEYAWDFDGDGTYESTSPSNPSPLAHSYNSSGLYNAKFRVTDDGGSWDVDTVSIYVSHNSPPVVILTTNPIRLYLGETGSGTVTFNASESYDPDGTAALMFAFDPYGDNIQIDNGYNPVFLFDYSDSGVFNAVATVMEVPGMLGGTASALVRVYRFGSAAVDSAGSVGNYTSLAVVNGYPAIGYYDTGNADLKYVRASDASGSSWGTPLTIDSAGDVGYYASLAVVDGNPAIGYRNNTSGDLKYVRASNANGSSWGAPYTIASAGDVGQFLSLAVVNGNPAISYYDGTNTELKYVRATDADGSSWGIPLTVDSVGNVGWDTSLEVVDGYPAISYYDVTDGDLFYVRANDADGNSWGLPITPDSNGAVGRYTSLAVVNGNPAISYFDGANTGLKYVRASDADGNSWGAPVYIDSDGSVGQYSSLAVVNGYPAIGYCDSGYGDLKYVLASDINGNNWGDPITIDSAGDVGYFLSLAVVNGNPAISHDDETNGDLKFAYPRLD
jgi:PKD repeat protein